MWCNTLFSCKFLSRRGERSVFLFMSLCIWLLKCKHRKRRFLCWDGSQEFFVNEWDQNISNTSITVIAVLFLFLTGIPYRTSFFKKFLKTICISPSAKLINKAFQYILNQTRCWSVHVSMTHMLYPHFVPWGLAGGYITHLCWLFEVDAVPSSVMQNDTKGGKEQNVSLWPSTHVESFHQSLPVTQEM